jgi:hypothetical protein
MGVGFRCHAHGFALIVIHKYTGVRNGATIAGGGIMA